MPRVWLIRHGQSEANAGLRSASASDIPLTELGRQQAGAVAARFGLAPAEIAYSRYTRAAQTAEPTRSRFPGSPASIWAVHEFTYLSPERCANTTWAERVPMVGEYWNRADPDHVDGSGVESFRQFLTRVDETLERLADEAAPLFAIFTHGQFMQAAMWRVGPGAGPGAPERMAEFRTFMLANPVPNAAVLELELEGGAARIGRVQTDHLGKLPITF